MGEVQPDCAKMGGPAVVAVSVASLIAASLVGLGNASLEPGRPRDHLYKTEKCYTYDESLCENERYCCRGGDR